MAFFPLVNIQSSIKDHSNHIIHDHVNCSKNMTCTLTLFKHDRKVPTQSGICCLQNLYMLDHPNNLKISISTTMCLSMLGLRHGPTLKISCKIQANFQIDDNMPPFLAMCPSLATTCDCNLA